MINQLLYMLNYGWAHYYFLNNRPVKKQSFRLLKVRCRLIKWAAGHLLHRNKTTSQQFQIGNVHGDCELGKN
jgi:hypothetical protein